MSKDDILQEKLAGLYSRRNAGIKFGLDVQETLMRRLGDPQNKYAVVHVAGTNGKGSVCSMIAEVLIAAGIKAGLYISPHLVEFNERIRVNGESVSDSELLRLAELVDAQVPEVERECGRQPSFFEYSTALAMKHFEAKGVQVAVLETGMGGRLDATNIVTPVVSVVTRIGIEHSEFLGDTIEAIAGEKAGIVKGGRPVVCGAMPPEARAVLEQRAKDSGCMFRAVEDSVAVSGVDISIEGQRMRISTDAEDYGLVTMGLIGTYQTENCATAVAALEEIQRAMGLSFGVDSVKEGLKKVCWPGRCQVLSKAPPLILDGAHNPAASQALGQTLRKLIGTKPLALVIGMCGDKDSSSFVAEFRNVKKVWTVTIENERAVPAADLAAIISAAGFEAKPCGLDEALAASKAWAQESGGAVCITGSLFLAGEVLELIGKNERS